VKTLRPDLARVIAHPHSREVTATTPRPPVPIAMESGAAEDEERRAFFQSRLALFGRWIFTVSGGFLVFLRVVRMALGVPFDPGSWFHALATLLAGVIWAVGSSARLSFPVMKVVDVGGTWLICASFAMMTLGFARSMTALAINPTPVLYVGLLAGSYVLMIRAIAMPSTVTRTTWVGIGTVAALAVLDAVVLSWANLTPQALAASHAEMASWNLAAVAMSAVASQVIFGLREEVRQVRRLGQYTLEEKIGEGGMGIVYRARHAMLRRPTAIKLLPPEKAGNDNILRFEREVQLTAALSHPNTVAIFDYGRTADGIFYYAMEYLDGLNLDQLVKLEGTLPARRVVHILRQVCGALAEAHDVGLVHRDVKPANIILCERGGLADVAKVVDFGLVKRFRTDPADVTLAATVGTTLVGTPLFMAPECFSGEGQVDARSDLYALGAVAYLLLTGTPVFSARTVVEVCAHHLHTQPDPLSKRLGTLVPVDLERLVLQCLAKSPADRPQSARALGRDLDRYASLDVWSEADAESWWADYRRTRVTARSSAAPDPLAGDVVTRSLMER
jgi:eukaryotic-like serine/threonine-protein kinase